MGDQSVAVVNVRLGVTPFAVIDVETTGLSPSKDRIVEIAIVRLNPDGSFVDSWDSMVNPRRNPGPTFAHGLTSEDLESAPLFMALADEITQRLDGAVVVAHNVNFDFNFLKYEYGRIGKYVPAWPCMCTVQMANVLGRVQGSRKLADLCAREWVHVVGDHSALGDAEATAKLLGVYLRYAATAGLDFGRLGARPLDLPDCTAVAPLSHTNAVPRGRP